MVRKVRGTDLVISNVEENISSRSVGRSLEVGWTDDDARWGNPPCLSVPTLVKTMVEIVYIQNMDTVCGTVNVRLKVKCIWKDPRLAGRSRADPLPTHLWSPRLDIKEALGDFTRRTSDFSILAGSMEGDIYTSTWLEGTIWNIQDLHIFLLDTDSVEVTFTASECYKRSGEVNVNYKSDYRMYFY